MFALIMNKVLCKMENFQKSEIKDKAKSTEMLFILMSFI